MLQSLFLYTAIAGGAVLGLQLILVFLGGGDDGLGESHGDASNHHSADGDGHHSSSLWFFEMVSLRTLAAAAMFFGLVGLTAQSYDAPPKVALLAAGAAGFAAMYSVYWMFTQLFKLESSGNQDITNALGLPATVYLRIPARNEGRGKVQLTMQNRIVEYLAITDDPEPIPSGENVWVTEVVNGDTLRIARATPIIDES